MSLLGRPVLVHHLTERLDHGDGASITTLQVYDRDDVSRTIWRAGERLREGLRAASEKTGHRIRQTGPATMPTLLFEDDPKLETGRRFSREAALRGALFHPNLNWFLNAAHDDEAIDEALAIAEEAFRATPLPVSGPSSAP